MGRGGGFFLCAAAAVLALSVIVIFLLIQGMPAFKEIGVEVRHRHDLAALRR